METLSSTSQRLLANLPALHPPVIPRNQINRLQEPGDFHSSQTSMKRAAGSLDSDPRAFFTEVDPQLFSTLIGKLAGKGVWGKMLKALVQFLVGLVISQ